MQFSNKKIQAENKYLQAIQQDFTDNQWKTGNVITLKSTKSGNGGFILALTKEKQVILNREYKFWNDEFVYNFPSGWVEKWLTGEENIRKELQEETGYTTNEEIIFLWKVMQNWYIQWYNELYFTYNCVKNTEVDTHEGEEIETFVFTLEEFEQMILENKILDPYTICAYFLAKEKTNNFSDLIRKINFNSKK